MRAQKDLKTRKNGVNKIENQGEFFFKMLQNGQITDFGEKIDQLRGHIISGTKCDRDKPIFPAERRVQSDQAGLQKSTQWDRKMSNMGVLTPPPGPQ